MPEVDVRHGRAHRREERFRRLDARDEPARELGDERPRPAADVERRLRRGDSGRVAERRRERRRVPADAATIRIGARLEARRADCPTAAGTRASSRALVV
jgi:hypothetical protein